MHGINKKTLMWYDETDVFKPVTIKENGYRYYSYSQSPTLETILLLRELNVPLDKIKDFMNGTTPQGLMKLFDEQLNAIDEDISRLKAIRKSLIYQKDELSMLVDLDLSQISIVEEEAEQFIMIRIAKDTSWEKQLKMIMEETKKYKLHNIHDASYGYMISTENLYRNEFDNYYAIFIKVSALPLEEDTYTKSKGTYLRAYCQGDYDKLKVRYQELLAYAKQNHIKLTGYSFEKGINELVTGVSDMSKFITQIDIPILRET
ncbi:TPA: MerR family transcriptional regulator [Clostridioides difficile]|nr:MerR family transcriptional regulator [Clostridioides difficile]HEK9084517.1 MerR family transcriptional regulator [Clostridioides difficile]